MLTIVGEKRQHRAWDPGKVEIDLKRWDFPLLSVGK